MTVLRIGLAGLGTVGAEVFRLLTAREDMFRVMAVSARNRSKNRGLNLGSIDWVDNPLDMATRTDIDVVIELMGGDSDPAYGLVKAALSAGKKVVTANKALLARHGTELSKLAEGNNTTLSYEAAVAGGIPVIKMMREGLSANQIHAIYGVLNGTCNYILTAMELNGQGFDAVLSEAQSRGYAEADPTLDVDGGDTGHKLAILTSLAFGCPPDRKATEETGSVEGIRHISASDIQAARNLGYRIKLVGMSTCLANGKILQMVTPSLVPLSCPLSHVEDVLNAILIEGNLVGQSFISGRGAGAGPTASAVMADMMDIVNGDGFIPTFGKKADTLKDVDRAGLDEWQGEFYLRLVVEDRPGVIADIAPILRDAGISIESLIQHGKSEGSPVHVVIITHEAKGHAIMEVVQKMSHIGSVVERPLVMPILKI